MDRFPIIDLLPIFAIKRFPVLLQLDAPLSAVYVEREGEGEGRGGGQVTAASLLSLKKVCCPNVSLRQTHYQEGDLYYCF